MADVESSLRTLALSNAAVAATFGTRFHWNHIPDNETYPCVRAVTVSDNAGDTHSNNWGGQALVQLDVYDDDKAGCNAAAETLKAWLHRYHGGMGTYNVTIKVTNYPSFFEADARLFRRMLELEILYLV